MGSSHGTALAFLTVTLTRSLPAALISAGMVCAFHSRRKASGGSGHILGTAGCPPEGPGRSRLHEPKPSTHAASIIARTPRWLPYLTAAPASDRTDPAGSAGP